MPIAVSTGLFLALSLLRWQACVDLSLGIGDAWTKGLLAGLVADWQIAAYSIVWPAAVSILSIRSAFVMWVALSLAVWLVTLANVLYARSFGGPLPLWAIGTHFSDLGNIWSAIAQMVQTHSIASSAFVFVATAVFAFTAWNRLRNATRRAKFGHVIVLVGFVMVTVAVRTTTSRREDVLVVSRNAILTWWSQVKYDGVESALYGALPGSDADIRAWNTLKEYGGYNARLNRGSARDGQTAKHAIMAQTKRHDVPQASRRRLGLPIDGPINVVLVFVESLRGYDFLHPSIGPTVFPNLHQAVSKHGLLFTQAYSSANGGGQSARGLFCSLCSALPRFRRPALIATKSADSAKCVQSVFKEAGYVTAWFSAISREFHGQGSFEKAQGTEHIVDDSFFSSRQIHTPNRIGGFGGLSDAEFLGAVADELHNLAESRPVFAHAATVSTHVPYKEVPGYRVAHIAEESLGDEESARLSTFAYSDRALGMFLSKLFSGPLAERLLVVVTSDHSVPGPRLEPATQLQKEEDLSRIVLALLTRDMPHAERLDKLVHHLDIAPTLAAVAGLSIPSSWLGHNMLDAEVATAYLASKGGLLRYRTSDRLCQRRKGSSTECFGVQPGVDPLFVRLLPRIPEIRAETDFFLRASEAADTVSYR